MFRRFKFSITILVLLILTIGLGGLSLLNYFYAKHRLHNDIEQATLALTEYSSKETGMWLTSRISEISLIANTPLVRSGDQQNIIKYLHTEVMRNPVYEQIFVADRQGRYYLDSGQTGSISDRTYFQQVLASGRPVVSDPIISRGTGNLIVVVAAPIMDKGRVIGIVGGNVNINEICKSVARMSVGEGSYVFIVQQNGLMIAHPNPGLVLHYNPLNDQDAPAGFKRAVYQMTGGGKGLLHYSDPQGAMHLAYSWVPGTQWYLGTVVPESYINNQLGFLLPQFVGIALLLIVVLGVSLRKWLVKPLAGLAGATTALARNPAENMRWDIPPSPVAEVDSLLHNFRSMATALGESFQTLQSTNERLANEIDERAIAEEELLKSYEELSAAEEELRCNYEKLQSQEVALQRERNLFYSIIEYFPCGVIVLDNQGRVTNINVTLTRLLGYTLEDLPDLKAGCEKFYPDIDYRQKVLEIWQKYTGQSGGKRILQVQCKNGGFKDIEFWPTFLPDGRIIIAMFDVTERRQAEEQLKHLASHDFLTGVPNRYYFEKALEKAVTQAINGEHSALLLIDVDNFKLVNDTWGHTTGDDLLVRIVSVIKQQVRAGDLVARLGGDEFVVLLGNIETGAARETAKRICKAVEGMEVQTGEQEMLFNLSLSIGMVMVDGTQDVQRLLVMADTALYTAKDDGRNRVVYLGDRGGSANRFNETKRLLMLVKEALKNNNLQLHLQPVVDVRDGLVAYHEVLVRLEDANGELIFPGAFLPIAERFGLMPQVDCQMVQSSLKLLQDHPDLRLSVNISGISLGDQELLQKIEEMILSSGINPGRIGFEITETATVQNFALAKRWIRRLKESGCSFAIDDFGVGFSSFSYLRLLPVDYLKIDGSFIRNIESDHTLIALVRAMNAVAHELGKKTIAEYVENKEILNILHELGVDCGQGYYWSKPYPAGELYYMKPGFNDG